MNIAAVTYSAKKYPTAVAIPAIDDEATTVTTPASAIYGSRPNQALKNVVATSAHCGGAGGCSPTSTSTIAPLTAANEATMARAAAAKAASSNQLGRQEPPPSRPSREHDSQRSPAELRAKQGRGHDGDEDHAESMCRRERGDQAAGQGDASQQVPALFPLALQGLLASPLKIFDHLDHVTWNLRRGASRKDIVTAYIE